MLHAFPLRVKMAHYNMQSTRLVVYLQHLSPQIAQLDSAENACRIFISQGEHRNNTYSPALQELFHCLYKFSMHRSALQCGS
jgi:hypothetical protein